LEHWREQFLSQVSLQDPDKFPFVIVGNKIDLDKRVVPQKRAIAWCQSKGNLPYFETSAKDATHVEEAFQTIAKLALEQDKGERFISLPEGIQITPTGEKQKSGCSC